MTIGLMNVHLKKWCDVGIASGGMDTKNLALANLRGQMTTVHGEKGEKMRLIDADALSKLVGEPIEVFLRRLDLKLPPIVDAVPVVRCKDCIHFWDGVCKAHNDVIYVDDNDFCSRGEMDEVENEQ